MSSNGYRLQLLGEGAVDYANRINFNAVGQQQSYCWHVANGGSGVTSAAV